MIEIMRDGMRAHQARCDRDPEYKESCRVEGERKWAIAREFIAKLDTMVAKGLTAGGDSYDYNP